MPPIAKTKTTAQPVAPVRTVAPSSPARQVVLPVAAGSAQAKVRERIGTEFVYFIVENAYGYKGKHMLRLRDVGLVNVIGQNLESKTPSSSGAGKTRIWRLFLYLIYGKVALEGVEKIKDLSVFGVNFRLELGYVARDGKCYILRECRKHETFPDGISLTLCPEGFNSKVRTPTGPENAPQLLRAYVQNQFNLTYKEATGTVIWPQGFGHTLIRGKPSERVQWLSDLNGLTQYDEMHKDFTDRLRTVRAEINDLLEFRGQYQVIEEDLRSLTANGSIDEVKQRGRELKESTETLARKISEARATISSLDLEIANLQRLSSAVSSMRSHNLEPSERDLATRGVLLSSFERDIASVVASVETARQTLEDYDRYSALCEELGDVSAEEGTGELQSELTKLISEDIPEARRALALSAESLEDIAAVERDLRADMATNVALLKIKPTLEDVNEFLSEAGAEEAEISGKIAANSAARTKMARALALTSGCECPTCLQKVTNTDVIRDAVAEIDDENKKLAEDRQRIVGDVRAAQDMLDIFRELAQLPQRKSDAHASAQARQQLPILQRRAQELHGLVSAARENERKLTERDLLAERLAGVDVAAIEEQLQSLESTSQVNDEKRSRYQQAQADYEFAFSAASEIGYEDPLSIDADAEIRNKQVRRDQVFGWLEKAEAKRLQDSARIQQLLGIVRAHAEKTAHLTQITEKVDRLLVLEDEEKILAACIKAYSKSGMKVEKLKAIMDKISERLPKWVKLLFTEPYFAVRVSGDATKLSLQVRKKFDIDGKPLIKWVDASALSGGEESRFAICVMLTLSELVAKEKRTNLMVLDETDRSCDAFGQQLIASILIPLMRRRKPSMFVITHQLHLDPAVVDANLYVTKHKTGVTDIKLIPNSRSR